MSTLLPGLTYLSDDGGVDDPVRYSVCQALAHIEVILNNKFKNE